VAVTLAAFATSSPELSIAIGASVAGTPEISLGDALGSNVVNVALILGLVLSFGTLHGSRNRVRHDFPMALFVPIFLALLAFDGTLSHADGALLLSVFFVWLGITVATAWRRRDANKSALEQPHVRFAAGFSIAGLALLVAAGKLIVAGAEGIAMTLGLNPYVIGATLVAIGTSIPELATAIVSRWRGHDEVGLGTLLGSNLFNGLFIVGTAASITPVRILWTEVSIALAFGIVTVIATFPGKSGTIGRARGPALLALYAAYVVMTLRASS
jgi:cation:H+ antiporter